MKYPEQQLHRKQKKISGCVGQEVETELSRGFSGGSVVKNQETQVQSLAREDPLEKEMAPHSSILAWLFPWIEEPAGIQSMRSQKSQILPSDETTSGEWNVTDNKQRFLWGLMKRF